MIPKRWIVGGVALVATLAAFAALSWAETETSVGKVTVGGVTIHESETATVRIDAAYAKKYHVAVSLPFEFVVPRRGTLAVFPPKTGGALVKLNFGTAGEKPELIENLQWTTLRVDPGPVEVRRAAVRKGLVEKGLPRAFRGFSKPEALGTFDTRVAGFDAVAATGRYVDPTIGPMFVLLVAVIHPDSEQGLLAVANLNPKHSDVKSPADLAPAAPGMTPTRGRVWQVLGTLKIDPVTPSP